jgi:hypothetical protein
VAVRNIGGLIFGLYNHSNSKSLLDFSSISFMSYGNHELESTSTRDFAILLEVCTSIPFRLLLLLIILKPHVYLDDTWPNPSMLPSAFTQITHEDRELYVPDSPAEEYHKGRETELQAHASRPISMYGAAHTGWETYTSATHSNLAFGPSTQYQDSACDFLDQQPQAIFASSTVTNNFSTPVSALQIASEISSRHIS